MDKLLSSFTKKYINIFTESELTFLCDFLDLDDENLYRFNQGKEISLVILDNKVSKLFKNYRYNGE